MKKIILNGCFDILHLGHINLLRFAKATPNSFVYVLIDSDQRIKKIKGQERPIFNEYERASMLFNLKTVDRVDIFETEEEMLDLMKAYKPDIMIKGGDYEGKEIVGSDLVEKIIFFPRMEKYSTTNIIKRIKKDA